MANQLYQGEEVYVKESSFNHISPCIIAKTMQGRGVNGGVYLDTDGLALSEIFIEQAPKIAFLGHYSHSHFYAGHTSRVSSIYSISSVIKDLGFMRERFPETKLVTIASPEEYRKFKKNGAAGNICRRCQTNLDLEIAILSAEFLK